MSRRIALTVFGLCALFIAVALTITWVFIANKKSLAPNNEPPQVAPNVPAPLPAPEINIYKSGTAKKPTLIITWKNLTPDMVKIKIYRSSGCGTGERELWKIIDVQDVNDARALEIVLKPAEASCIFSYTIETLTTTGEVSWSSPTPSEASTLPPGASLPPNSSSTVTNPPPGLPSAPPFPPPGPVPPNPPPTPQPTSPGTVPPTTPPAPLPPPTSGGETPPPPDGNQKVYYDPESKPSGYYTPQTGTFWVQHISDAIEFGWQALPTSTNILTVSRSSATNGPWSAVIHQEQPDIIGPYTIRIASDALNQPFYYQLEVFEGTTLIAIYGPVLLPPAAQ